MDDLHVVVLICASCECEVPEDDWLSCDPREIGFGAVRLSCPECDLPIAVLR